MNIIEFFPYIFVSIGGFLILTSMVISFKIKKIVPSKYTQRWNIITFLMFFFFVGYIFYIFIHLFNISFSENIVSSVIFFGGGFFVFLIISLTRRTVYAINRNEELEILNKKLSDANVKLNLSENTLKQRNYFLDRVIESLSHPFYVIDVVDYSIKLANAASRLGDLTNASTCYALTHKRNEPCGSGDHVCPLEEVKKTRKPVAVEHVHYDKDGNQRNVEVHAHPIFDDNGSLIQMLEYSIDFTAKKKAEDELREKTEKFEISNNQLSIAQQQLEKLLEQKNEFIRMLGHDLKNPLSPLLILLPVVEKKTEDSEVKEWIQVCIRNVKSLKDMLFKTLELAKNDELGMKVDFSNIVLKDKVNRIIESKQVLFNENDLRIENKIDEVFIVKADDILLGEIFDNLFTNAVKYSPSGGSIHVDAEVENEFVKISVSDNGMGLTMDQIEHVFDAFYKGDDVKHVMEMDSHGLGLSIVKRIVEKHGGKIWAESPGIGKGSTFYFTVPIVK